MAGSIAWMSRVSERSIFSEEIVLTIRRKMRAVSLLAAGLPIVCILNKLWSQPANNNNNRSTSRTADSSTDKDSNSRVKTTTTSGKGEHIKEEEEEDDDQDQNHEEMQCIICLYNVLEGEKYRVLEECSHGFHVDCIDSWLMQNSTCPLCRCSVAYAPEGKQQPSSISYIHDDQEAYYKVVIASIQTFLGHLWTWFLDPLGLDQRCPSYHAYL